MNDEEIAIRQMALNLFQSSLIEGTIVREKGVVGAPLRILHPDGDLASWFVPVTVGDRIVGFFQFNTNHQLLRYASFQRNPENVDTCPPEASWLDPETVINQAATIAMKDETLSSPVLTYDKNITRIAWAVKATKPDGKSRLIYVTGAYAYPERDQSAGPST
jgi:hypothetical protein